MKIQDINENGNGTSIKDLHDPKDIGIPSESSNLKTTRNSDIPAGLFELLQQNNTTGLGEFEALKHSSQVDMGSIKSRDLGDMLSGELVQIGEAAAKVQNPDVDFGDLPSRALTQMGKDVIKSE